MRAQRKLMLGIVGHRFRLPFIILLLALLSVFQAGRFGWPGLRIMSPFAFDVRLILSILGMSTRGALLPDTEQSGCAPMICVRFGRQLEKE